MVAEDKRKVVEGGAAGVPLREAWSLRGPVGSAAGSGISVVPARSPP